MRRPARPNAYLTRHWRLEPPLARASLATPARHRAANEASSFGAGCAADARPRHSALRRYWSERGRPPRAASRPARTAVRPATPGRDAPHCRHPVLGKTVAELLTGLAPDPDPPRIFARSETATLRELNGQRAVRHRFNRRHRSGDARVGTGWGKRSHSWPSLRRNLAPST